MDLQNPIVRWGIGLWGGLTIAAVALLFLDGTVQLIALGIAVVDIAVTPLILKVAAKN